MDNLENVSDSSFDDEVIEVDNIINNVTECEIITLEENINPGGDENDDDVIEVLDDSVEEILVSTKTSIEAFHNIVNEPPITQSIPTSSSFHQKPNSPLIPNIPFFSTINGTELSEGEIESDQEDDPKERINDQTEQVASTSTISASSVAVNSDDGLARSVESNNVTSPGTQKRERSPCKTKSSGKRSRRKRSSSRSKSRGRNASPSTYSKVNRERSINRRRRERLIRHERNRSLSRIRRNRSSSRRKEVRSSSRRRGDQRRRRSSSRKILGSSSSRGFNRSRSSSRILRDDSRNRSSSRNLKNQTTRVEEISISTVAIKEEIPDSNDELQIVAIKTPSPTQEFLISDPVKDRDLNNFSRSSRHSNRSRSGNSNNQLSSSRSRGSADSRENDFLPTAPYKGSFLEMAEKVLAGTLVGQSSGATGGEIQRNALEDSEYQAHYQQELIKQQEKLQTELNARLMLVKFKSILKHREQNFSNTVVLKLSGSPNTSAVAHNIHQDMCDFLNHGPKSISCRNIPLVYMDGKLTKVKFYHKIQAVAFLAKYSGCYNSNYPNMSIAEPVYDSNEIQDISFMSLAKNLPYRAGMPKRSQTCNFLFCSISMTTISSESVHLGKVTDPISISFAAGNKSITKNVIPLTFSQNLELQTKVGLKLDNGHLYLADQCIMNEETEAPKHFFDAMFEVLVKNLKQNNSESKFDEAVLVFKSWEDVSTFVNWVNLAEYDKILQNYVSLFGVIPCSGDVKDLKEIYRELTNVKISHDLQCQEECLMINAILEEKMKHSREFCGKFINMNCVDTESIFTNKDDCDGRMIADSNVCIVSLEFINDEENYFITQLGACIFNKTKTGRLNKKLNFSVVLPEGPMVDNILNFDLGISRNSESGNLEFFHEQQKKKYQVVPEKGALLALFSFVSSNQGISGMEVSTTTLFSYSSYSTLPVILQAVRRNKLEKEFYQTFSSFTDFHMLASQVETSKIHFQNGIPHISKLAEGIAGIKCITAEHPANGMASLLYTLVEKILKTGDQSFDLEMIRKISRSSACLQYSKQDNLKQPLVIEKDFQLLSGKKGELSFNIILNGSILDPSTMMVVTCPEVSKDVEITSKVSSYEKLSMVLKNYSKDPFIHKKGAVFGHLIPPPLPLEIPSVLPHLERKPNLSRHSSAECVVSDFDNPKPLMKLKLDDSKYLKKSESKLVKSQSLKNSDDGVVTEVTSFLESSPGQNTFDDNNPSSQNNFPSYNDKRFELMAIAVECIKFNDNPTIEPIKISIKSLYRSKASVTIYIKPWDHSSYPEAHVLCHFCSKSYGLHLKDICPARGYCILCNSNHKKVDCQRKICWNCGKSHNWRNCAKPILTNKQKSLEKFGYRFLNSDRKAVIKYIDVDNKHYTCLSKGNAMKKVVDVLEKGYNVLVGYNLSTILDILLKEAGKSRHNQILKKKIRAMIDIKWLFPENFRTLPFKDLFQLCFNDGPMTKNDTQTITEAIETIISLKVDLSKFKSTNAFVSDFAIAIRFNQENLAVFNKNAYKPEGSLFIFDAEFQAAQERSETNQILQQEPSIKTVEDTQLVTQCYSRYISKPIMVKNPELMVEEKVNSVKLFSISIKTCIISGKNHLLTLSLYDITEDRLVSFKGIVPADLYKMTPQKDSYECRNCLSKPSFHFGDDCPLLEKCKLCELVFEINHTKGGCQNFDMCWNCGEVHNWRSCSKPWITEKQKDFKEVGLDFDILNQMKVVVLKKGGKMIECQRDVDALTDILTCLEAQDSVLIGYNITEILLDIFSCVMNSQELRLKLQKNVAGIVDLRWILGRMYRRVSLKEIANKILFRTPELEDSDDISKQIASIIRKICIEESSKKVSRFVLKFIPSLLLDLLSNDINMDSEMFQSYKNQIKVERDVLKEEGQTNEKMDEAQSNGQECEEHIKDQEKEELLVYIHLIVRRKVNVEIIEKIDVLIVNGLDKKRYSQMFDMKTQNSDQANFFFSQLEKGLTSVNAKSVTGVFVCPESFRMFGALLESHTGQSVGTIFTGWINLVSQAATSSTSLRAISYHCGQLAKLYSETFEENLAPGKNVCEGLKDIHEEVAKVKESLIQSVTLKRLENEDYCIVLVHISVDWEEKSDCGVHRIDTLAYQDLNTEEIVEHKSLNYSARTLLQEWKLMFEDRKVVLMSLQNDHTIPLVLANLLEHGGATHEDIHSIISGVCDFRSFMSKMGEEDFFSNIKSLEMMQSSTLLQLVTRILHGALGSSANFHNFLQSFGHSLDSPYFNKQLLISGLNILSENLVSLVMSKSCVAAPEKITTATVKVVSPWRIPSGSVVQIMSSSLPFIELEVEMLLEVSEAFTVDVEMLNVEFENVTIPEHAEIAKAVLIFKEDHVVEEKMKISVRTDLLANDFEPELEEDTDVPQLDVPTPTSPEVELANDEDNDNLLEEMSDSLLVTRLGFFRMEH